MWIKKYGVVDQEIWCCGSRNMVLWIKKYGVVEQEIWCGGSRNVVEDLGLENKSSVMRENGKQSWPPATVFDNRQKHFFLAETTIVLSIISCTRFSVDFVKMKTARKTKHTWSVNIPFSLINVAPSRS